MDDEFEEPCFWKSLWEGFVEFLSLIRIVDNYNDDDMEHLIVQKCQIKRIEQYDNVYKEARELFIKKNTDYGDAFASYGPIGVLVRMGDKTRRLSSIEKNKIINVNDETLRDTLIDLHNYSAMAIMLMDE
jgi:hypothetical protein